MSRKPRIAVTTDVVLFAGRPRKVLLVRRARPPYEGRWALPGGFLEEEEKLEAGARRELREETGIEAAKLDPLGAFGDPGRDPRGRVISIAFFGSLLKETEPRAADDAGGAGWHPVSRLPPLAFDHREIIDAALRTRAARRPSRRKRRP